MTTSLKPLLPQGKTRRILCWRYDDESISSDDAVDLVPGGLTLGEAVVALAGDTEDETVGQSVPVGDVDSLTSLAAERTRNHIREYNAALADIYAGDFATYGLEIGSAVGEIGSAVSGQARMSLPSWHGYSTLPALPR